MEADNGNVCTSFEKIENLSVPPGFASLTSFILKRGVNDKKVDKSTSFPIASEQEPIFMETKPEMDDITAYKQVLMHRPWIILDHSNHCKPEESRTEHLPRVTARWQPEDSRREILEEAPVFHPTEEEFKDTLKYIASIRSRAEPYGICRIVPPTCWKPPCVLEKSSIWEKSEFVAQIKRIDGHQVQHAQENMTSSPENTKTERKRSVKVALDSQVGNRNTSTPNNQNVEECDYESEPGPKFNLKTFKKYADEFKIQYFNHKDKNNIMHSSKKAICQQPWKPSVENIEGEYGRIAQNPTEEIKVLCGNNLKGGVFSCGFSSVSDPLEAYTCPEYLKSGWNLNNIPSLSGSLLSLESSEASRNFAPQIHVGMCFSPFNWKVEEHHLYSLSYVHLGEPKVWYGVPGRFAVKFETIWKKYLPGLDARQPDMHDNLRRKTLLSYDKLLLGAAREAVRAVWETDLCMKSTSDGLTCKDVYQKNVFLTKALNSRIQSESLKRKFLCPYLVSRRMDENFNASCKRECCICLRDLYLSAVGCSCSDDKFVCLNHAKQLCSCIWTEKILYYRYGISDLNVLCQALDGKLSAVFKWAKADLGLTLNSVTFKRSKQNPENISGSAGSSQTLQMKESTSQTVSDEYSKGKRPSQNLQMEESMSQTESDEYSVGKRRTLQEILNSSKEKQNEVVSGPSKKKQNQGVKNSSKKKQNQVVSQFGRTSCGTHSISNDIHSKMKANLLRSTFSGDMKGMDSVGVKVDTKAVGGKFTISKKAGDPNVSEIPPVTNSRYLSFLQEKVLFEVSSDSSGTSSSSDSDNA
ncbi:hypothetical protein Fmac_030027 [Flemingia macrophylla]|uniref:Uncharacterized protein n=1 Tax=Flemingia macrophylla TaxID=520843 RepID=A0ABD1LC02_9FABA